MRLISGWALNSQSGHPLAKRKAKKKKTKNGQKILIHNSKESMQHCDLSQFYSSETVMLWIHVAWCAVHVIQFNSFVTFMRPFEMIQQQNEYFVTCRVHGFCISTPIYTEMYILKLPSMKIMNWMVEQKPIKLVVVHHSRSFRHDYYDFILWSILFWNYHFVYEFHLKQTCSLSRESVKLKCHRGRRSFSGKKRRKS